MNIKKFLEYNKFKQLKKEDFKQLKYKEDDIVGYDKYLNNPTIPVRILKTTPKSKYPYFGEHIYPPYATVVLQEDDVVDLTPEQIQNIKLKIETDKYNL